MSQTLTLATSQWSSRPADQRYASLTDLHRAAEAFRASAVERTLPVARIAPTLLNGDVAIMDTERQTPVALTHWAFGQLARRAEAPASFLRTLPAPMVVDILKHRFMALPKADGDARANLLLHRNGQWTANALLTDSYTRVWNLDITSRLLALERRGPWQPAPAAFDGSRGLYLSDHDLFAFLVDSNRRIFETGPGGGLSRGFFVWNSEVGAASLGIMTFLYEYICGNHRVWGAQVLSEARLRHVGKALDRWGALSLDLTRYAESSAADDEARIQRARHYVLGASKDEVLDKLFGLRVPELTRSRIADAYVLAETREDWYGNPRSAWGMAGALTEMARDVPFGDERVAIDRAAGRVMALAG